MNKFEKIGDCAHRGGQEGALEAPRMDFGAHFGSLFDIIHQLLTRHGVRGDLEGTGKERNSHEAEKNREVTVKSREETRENREGTSKAGKGPLRHHEENSEGPGEEERSAEGKQSNDETRKSSEEAWKKLGKDRGSRRPPRPPSRREPGKEPAGSGKGQGGKPARVGKDH